MKNNKPHHQRLMIMQAQEILQHESKFHAKYGRRLNAENSTSNADSSKQQENQVSRFSRVSTATPTNFSIPKKTNQQQIVLKPDYLKGVGLHRDQGEILISGFKREENIEKRAATCPGGLEGSNPSVDRRLREDNPIKDKDNLEKLHESPIQANEADSLKPATPTRVDSRLSPKQEESLKRQKEKEETEDREREKVKFLKNLEDQERQKIITEYLQHVYSQHGEQPSSHTMNKKAEQNSRTFKVSKQGRVYSVLTRQAEKPGSGEIQVVTKPMPILHAAARNSQGEKKVVFRPQQSVDSMRFFNDWTNNVLTEYINSSDGCDSNATDGKEKDKLLVSKKYFALTARRE